MLVWVAFVKKSSKREQKYNKMFAISWLIAKRSTAGHELIALFIFNFKKWYPIRGGTVVTTLSMRLIFSPVSFSTPNFSYFLKQEKKL